MNDADEGLETIVNDCQRSGRSPQIALMQLLIAAENAAVVRDWLRPRVQASAYAERIANIMAQNDEGCDRVARMIASDVDRPPANGTVEDGIRFCRTLFDWSVQQSEEASVALYSFSSPSILRDATLEIARS